MKSLYCLVFVFHLFIFYFIQKKFNETLMKKISLKQSISVPEETNVKINTYTILFPVILFVMSPHQDVGEHCFSLIPF